MKSVNLIPESVLGNISDWFSFPHKELFCQIATSMDNHPHIRTMMLYEITRFGELIFMTRKDTQKWQDLCDNNKIAICMLDAARGQIIARGSSVLITSDIDDYWRSLPSQAQMIYLDMTNSIKPPENAPSNFAVICVKPQQWETLEIHQEFYLRSRRQSYILRDGSWVSAALSPV